jgi:hypothetical protein
VRVPDLDWPVDLFTDAIVPVARPLVVAPAKPALWPEMANSWIGGGTQSGFRWPVRTIDAAQIAL